MLHEARSSNSFIGGRLTLLAFLTLSLFMAILTPAFAQGLQSGAIRGVATD